MAKKKPEPKPERTRLRLEYWRASELTGNPGNYRIHPQKQVATMNELLHAEGGPGWAGTVLWNEADWAQHLVNGHLRSSLSGNEEIPVLVGSWTPEQEALILATHDTIGNLAKIEKNPLQELLRKVTTAGAHTVKMLAELADKQKITSLAKAQEFLSKLPPATALPSPANLPDTVPMGGGEDTEIGPDPITQVSDAVTHKQTERFPLAIVLGATDRRRWLDYKESIGRKGDTEAFLELFTQKTE